MTMQSDLRAELALMSGEPVPAELALALREDAAMAHHAATDAHARAWELELRVRWWRGVVQDYVGGRATLADLAAALASDDMREHLA